MVSATDIKADSCHPHRSVRRFDQRIARDTLLEYTIGVWNEIVVENYTIVRFIVTTILLASCHTYKAEATSLCLIASADMQTRAFWQPFNSLPCYICHCNEVGEKRCFFSCRAKRSLNFRYVTPDILVPGLSPVTPPTKRLRNRSPNRQSMSATTCNIDSRTYVHGSTWIETGPHSNELTVNQCMECSCSSHVVTCVVRNCPRLQCSQPVQSAGTCCLSCPAATSIRPQRNSHNAAGCSSISRSFRDGARWRLYLPSVNIITACFTCVCLGTREKCRKHVCPPAPCIKPTRRPGKCCPECQVATSRTGHRSSLAEMVLEGAIGRTSFPSLIESSSTKSEPFFLTELQKREDKISTVQESSNQQQNNNRKQEDCEFGGIVYRNNATFNPVLHPFGLQLCTKCFCKNGRVKCGRITCPDRYPCKAPILKQNSCCKECPGMTVMEQAALSSVKLYESRSCPRSRRSQVHVYKFQQKPSIDSSRFSLKYVFDRSHAPSTGSEQHEWELLGSRAKIYRTQMTHAQMLTFLAVERDKLHYIGSIKEKILLRLIDEERKWERCKSRCLESMLRMASTLATRAKRRWQQCKQDQQQSNSKLGLH